MKTNLKNVTFLFLIRLDSIQRLENIINVTNQIYKYFDTNVSVLEVDYYQNNILHRLLNKRIHYSFIVDKDNILHRTKYYNIMIQETTTPYLALWDTDIVIDKVPIINAIESLKKGSDVVYPYNGICYDVPHIIREWFLEKNDIRFLYKQQSKMVPLYDTSLVGGALFIEKDKFIYCGKENENHYGWGNDDFDRYYRFTTLGMKIHRVDSPLFHLSHPRISNSGFRSSFHQYKTQSEIYKIGHSSESDLFRHMNKLEDKENK